MKIEFPTNIVRMRVRYVRVRHLRIESICK